MQGDGFLYAGQEATVQIRHGTMAWFKIGKGVPQGCILSLCLFKFYAEFSSVARSCLTLWDPMDYSMTGLPVHHQLAEFTQTHVPEFTQTSSQWCHPTISSSGVPSSSRLQTFPALGSFQMSPFFASGGKSIEVWASASVLPMKIQDWFPLGWAGWIFLQPKGLSRVFSNTTVQKHQFFGTQVSL